MSPVGLSFSYFILIFLAPVLILLGSFYEGYGPHLVRGSLLRIVSSLLSGGAWGLLWLPFGFLNALPIGIAAMISGIGFMALGYKLAEDAKLREQQL